MCLFIFAPGLSAASWCLSAEHRRSLRKGKQTYNQTTWSELNAEHTVFASVQNDRTVSEIFSVLGISYMLASILVRASQRELIQKLRSSANCQRALKQKGVKQGMLVHSLISRKSTWLRRDNGYIFEVCRDILGQTNNILFADACSTAEIKKGTQLRRT
jgi:hypothetical protein